MCFNWKVLAGLAAVGVGIYVVAPGLVVGALPLLLFAACPLSMLLMAKGMGGMQGGQCTTSGQEQARQQGQAQHQGQPAPTSAGAALAGAASIGAASVNAAPADGALGREEQLAQLRARLAGVQAEQAALAEQVEALAAADGAADRAGAARAGVPTVVTEAEAIVRAKAIGDAPAPADPAGRPRTGSAGS